jgi:DNA-binding transcriptional LysR family regulator
MLSKYAIICAVVEKGSFSRAAQELGYAQSSVSQAVKAVEDELSCTLIDRKRQAITWTEDGKAYAPYLHAVASAETDLERKHKEMTGLENQTIRIGTFTSVSRDTLPPLIRDFRENYPGVRFSLLQGEYDNIKEWLHEGSIDLGFIAEAVSGDLMTDFLYEDEMLLVLPEDHPLAVSQCAVSLSALTGEPFILLDEGRYSTVLEAFRKAGVELNVTYKVYDDYSVLSMVRSHLGVSILFRNVLRGFEQGVVVRELTPPIHRRVALAYRDAETLPYAAGRFRNFIRKKLTNQEGEIV